MLHEGTDLNEISKHDIKPSSMPEILGYGSLQGKEVWLRNLVRLRHAMEQDSN